MLRVCPLWPILSVSWAPGQEWSPSPVAKSMLKALGTVSLLSLSNIYIHIYIYIYIYIYIFIFIGKNRSLD